MSRFSNYSEISKFSQPDQWESSTEYRIKWRSDDPSRIGYTDTLVHPRSSIKCFGSQERKSDNPDMSDHVLSIEILIFTKNSKLSWFFYDKPHTAHSSIILDKVANRCNLVSDRTKILDTRAVISQFDSYGWHRLSGRILNWSVSSRLHCETTSWNTFHSMWMCNS
jgi:hypothetical protein